jgi:sugar phosphate isomerase/epimerase
MPSALFVHVPYPQLAENLTYLTERRLNPEVFFSAEALDSLIPEQAESCAATLAAHGLACTIHTPFMDLNPGSEELLLREATRHRFRQVIAAAAILNPRVMVFHPGYDRWRYGEKQNVWLRHSLDTWSEVLALTEPIGCTVAVENIFEEEPSTLLTLLEEVNHPRFRHCFDVGHWNLFHAVGLDEWFAALGPWIAESHIHDNRGRRDDHAPIGEGSIDFPRFFDLMTRHAPDAAWTIEAHNRPCLERALTAIAPWL